uniref:Uncharacterized protein n=1 Tax=Caenorhabditis japonica TaxID=281687 RepID=A0A8R1IHB6_CAEJA
MGGSVEVDGGGIEELILVEESVEQDDMVAAVVENEMS